MLYAILYNAIYIYNATFLKELILLECNTCHYWYFLNFSFKFQPKVCNRCHDLLRISINLSHIAILNIKGSLANMKP